MANPPYPANAAPVGVMLLRRLRMRMEMTECYELRVEGSAGTQTGIARESLSNRSPRYSLLKSASISLYGKGALKR